MRYMSPWIQTTNQCNLRCPYCYIDQDSKAMPKEVYNKINETFLGMLEKGELERVIYRLAGGEPALTFDNWKGFVEEFLEKNNNKGFVNILTNMTILTDEMLDFYEKYGDKIKFSISLDGYIYSKPFADGTSSAQLVMENVEKLLSRNISEIAIMSVINEHNIGDIELLADWVAKRNLYWGVNLNHFFCGVIERDLICKNMKSAIDILIANDYDILHQLTFNNIKLDSHYDGCTAGKKLIAIGIDGNIYPCQTLLNFEPIGNIFSNDNLIQTLKSQKAYNVGYNFRLTERCKNCPLVKMCGGGCKIHSKEKNKNFTCDIVKSVVLYMLERTL